MRAITSTTRWSERMCEFSILDSKFLIAATAILMAAGTIGEAQAPPSSAGAELRAKFDRRLQDIAGRVDGVVGYEIVDATSGDRFAHLERETFPTASTIK